jgi:hypothetical protein
MTVLPSVVSPVKVRVELEQMVMGDLLGAGKVTTRLLVDGGTSVQVMLTQTARSSRSD